MNGPLILAIAWARQHGRRGLLMVAAIAVAISLVVFTTTSYRLMVDRSASLAHDLMGPWDVVMMPRIALQPTISQEFEQALRNDARVREVVRSEIVYVDIEDASDTTYYDSWRAAAIATIDGRAPAALRAGRWPETSPDVIEGTVSGGLANRWRVAIGDRMPIHGPGGVFELHIVGTTDEHLSHPRSSGVFVSAETLARLSGDMRRVDRLYVDLAGDVSPDEFLAEWEETMQAASPPTMAYDVTDFAAELGLDKTVKRLRQISMAASAIVLITAMFIVATSMMAGADERTRQLAMLRTIGATRRHIFTTVLIEGVALAAVGACIGVPLGILWLQGYALVQAELVGGLVLPNIFSLVLAVGISFAAVCIASIYPAWTASRVAPVAAMSPTAQSSGSSSVIPTAIIGVATLLASVVLGAVPGVRDMLGTLLATCLAMLCLALSVVCIVRSLVCVGFTVFGGVVARCFGLPGELLRLIDTAGQRRARGLVLTLAVCLGFSVIMNVWGRSMVTPFLPSPQLPEQIISLKPAGVPPEKAEVVAALSGLQQDRVLPMWVEQTMLGRDLIAMTKGGIDDIYVQILGVDPNSIIQQTDPLLPIDFSAGERDLAAALARPGGVIVPPSFAKKFALSVGDQFQVSQCGGGGEYTLTAHTFASLPGWQWVTKMGRMRSFDGKPVAPLLVSRETAQQLGITTVRHWLADTAEGADLSILRKDLQAIADAHMGDYEHAHFGPGQVRKPSVKMIATGTIADRMQTRSNEVIWVLGAIPLVTLLIAMLGVANAVAAGIRSRQWEFAVMRACGLEGPHARRMILAESTVLALVAGVISVVYGIIAAWLAIDVSLQMFDTGTGTPPLLIPWLDLVIAVIITLIAALFASVFPARRLGQQAVQRMLRQGRAAD